jgi:hypothetical protein
MNEKNESWLSDKELEPAPSSSRGDSDGPEAPSRRQLIERFGKFAAVSPALMLFASRGQSPDIHSEP